MAYKASILLLFVSMVCSMRVLGVHNVTDVSMTETSAETVETDTYHPKLDDIDSMLLNSMLKIVDGKFETLSKRISSLERSIGTLQYYSVRNFRVVNTHLHTLDTILHGMHSELGEADIQTRALERAMIIVKNEVKELNLMNSGMFEAMEQNLVLFQDDMIKQLNDIKVGVDMTNVKVSDLQNNTEHLQTKVDSLRASSDEIRNTTDGIRNSVNELIANMTTVVDYEEIDSTGSGEVDAEEMRYQELKVSETKMEMTCSKLFEYLNEKLDDHFERKDSKNQNQSCPRTDFDEFRNESKTLIKALALVNNNVLQSIQFYHHSGDLIERVLEGTETVAEEQVKLRGDVKEYLENSTKYFGNITTTKEYHPHTIPARTTTGQPEVTSDCNLDGVIAEVLRITKNATQLVEVLTDLATISASSMKVSLTELNREITRFAKIQEESRNSVHPRAESLVMEPEADFKTTALKDIFNRTEWIYQLVEAIASNTGWIPYIFHNMRFVESQVNKTLGTSYDTFQNSEKLLKILLERRPHQPPPFRPTLAPLESKSKEKTASRIFENMIIKPTREAIVRRTTHLPSPVVQTCENTTNDTSSLSHMMQFVYETNVKMDRLLPALTNLLGEPEPYVTLVDGQNYKEGRVEIFNKGRWGTICDKLGHVEASYICRYLGYLGGVSAGSGYFGPGSGTFWTVNVTCLRTRWCDVVSPVIDPKTCTHSNDFSVICDHMVRLVTPDDEGTSRNSGIVEVYHNSQWNPVCSTNWTDVDTTVVCRQLGFASGKFAEVKDTSMVNTHWLVNTTCSGSENRIDACQHGGWQYNGCPEMNKLSVICDS